VVMYFAYFSLSAQRREEQKRDSRVVACSALRNSESHQAQINRYALDLFG
jgi:hypothetical protein